MLDEPEIVDSHCHLDFPHFSGELDAIIERAVAAGVRRIVTICTKWKNMPAAIEIAERYPEVYFAAGTHPHYAATQPLASVESIIAHARHPKMVGIGESGLDYHYTSDTMAAQKQSLRIHIEAARQTGLPLIIHSRDADKDMMEILTTECRQSPFECVMHCFSSGPELAKRAVDLGFCLSMSGIITFKNSKPLRNIFRSVPLDRILVETDAPFLAPQPFRGKRNEPAYTRHTALAGAELANLPFADFARVTTANFDRLFFKAAQPPRTV